MKLHISVSAMAALLLTSTLTHPAYAHSAATLENHPSPAGQTAAPQALPASFFGGTEQGKKIDYKVLDLVLRTSVLAEGIPQRSTVTEREQRYDIYRSYPVGDHFTALAANRFHFEEYQHNPEMRDVIGQLRRQLSAVPDQTPLNQLTKNEQLAYWLNLYNITVLDEVIKVYPRKDLETFLLGTAEQPGILSQKILTVAGVRLSLDDIQFAILPKQFPEQPELIYGLYQGVIGSPNIPTMAYTGSNVQQQLVKNAAEFINSNRGTLPKGTLGFRVSSFYQRSAAYFPDFQTDLRKHLATYLRLDEQPYLQGNKTILTNLSNYSVTDVYGTLPNTKGHKTAVKVAALPLGPVVARKLTSEQLERYHLLKQRGQTMQAKQQQTPTAQQQPAAAI
ncbi:DUF547 domain-containing protein [Rheinheimera texasensis]|uniref:DUF547 domain-containing protein n=1 Tax=Rheinheimera texasensis TaxID=306205 RepID=UPI0004E216AB|nr:DUF547 domain-containing protein [Rheinheimera texasensis]